MATESLLQQRLGYQFNHGDLLQQALTHRSFSGHHNERMEFLGDSLVNMIAAKLLYAKFPKASEGLLTSMRAKLVCRESLAEIARSMELSDHMQVGTSLRDGAYRFDSILSDTLEALIGAIYLDSGHSGCETVLEPYFIAMLENIDELEVRDAKSRLQEWLQGRGLPVPEYQVMSITGPAHQREFQVNCHLAAHKKIPDYPEQGVMGTGKSRRMAEQQAAKRALEQLQVNH